MRVRNKIDRYNLILDVLKYTNIDENQKENLKSKCLETLRYHNEYILKNGKDIPEVKNFKWNE